MQKDVTTNVVMQMNYESIFKFLNKKFGRCYSNSEYYLKVDLWTRLYQGYVKEHHEIVVQNGVSTNTRTASRLDMAKRVAEDWCSVLVADKPIITIAGKNQSTSRFVQGSKGNGGVLNSNNFYKQFCKTVERAFGLGTSALVLGLKKTGADESYKIDINTYDANAIIPISYSNDIIEECAFLSSFYKDDKLHYNLSCHVKDEEGKYVIYNYETEDDLKFERYFKQDVEGLKTESLTPFFFIVEPQIANNVDLNSPMGISVYANATDIVLNCDFIYDAIKLDVLTAQRIILMDKSLLGMDASGNPIAPQDYKKWCMSFFGDEGGVDVEKLLKEFSPKLNSPDLCNTLQQNLNLLSMRCGLGNGYYHFDRVSGITATEYVGSQQDLIRNAKVNSEMLTNILVGLIKQIIWIGRNTLGYKELLEDAKITITIPDGVVTNDLTEKEQDRADVSAGLMSKAEYRAKWYGETLEDAQAKIDAMNATQNKEENNNDTEGTETTQQNTVQAQQ